MYKFIGNLKALNILAAFVLVAMAVVTIVLSNMAIKVTQENSNNKFSWSTDQITQHVQLIMNEYANTLSYGRSFILNSNSVTLGEWIGFFQNQDIFSFLKGLHSVSYVELVKNADKDQFIRSRQASRLLSNDFAIRPDGERDQYGITTLIVSRNQFQPSGYDALYNVDSRTAYEKADLTGKYTTSGQLVISNGLKGLVIALPVKANGLTKGYVSTEVTLEDFFLDAILQDQLKISDVKIVDTTDSNNTKELYRSANWQDTGGQRENTRKMSFGERTWDISFQARTNYQDDFTTLVVPYLVLGTGLSLICVLFFALYSFTRGQSSRLRF